MKMTKKLAKKVLSIVDEGLCSGMGVATPGQMCVEAAVCFAMGLPHGDEPPCVSPAVRKLKICLNDASWSSNEARAKGMRRLAIAQLGTSDSINDQEFAKLVSEISIRKVVPRALEHAAKVHPDKEHKKALKAAAARCRKEGTESAAEAANSAASAAWSAASAAWSAAAGYSAAWSAAAAAWSAAEAAANSAEAAAWSAAWSAAAAARDEELMFFAEEVVQVLIKLKAEGTKWLDLTE